MHFTREAALFRFATQRTLQPALLKADGHHRQKPVGICLLQLAVAPSSLQGP